MFMKNVAVTFVLDEKKSWLVWVIKFSDIFRLLSLQSIIVS